MARSKDHIQPSPENINYGLDLGIPPSLFIEAGIAQLITQDNQPSLFIIPPEKPTPSSRTWRIGGKEIKFSKTEHRLLSFFHGRENLVFNRTDVIQAVWGERPLQNPETSLSELMIRINQKLDLRIFQAQVKDGLISCNTALEPAG